MIRIFRKIRHKLLSKNSYSRYLLYASGEIMLVVLGILIAVQVNTFKNKREIIELEKKILYEIENNLAGDIIEIQDEIESFNIILKVNSILLEHFQVNQPYHDSIGAHIHVIEKSPHFSPTRSGYNLLESKGIDLISNDSLRIQITDLYERSMPYYFTYAEERFHMIETLITPYLTKHFYLEKHPKWPHQKRVPMDYESLLNDPGIIALVQTSSYHAFIMLRRSRNIKSEIESLQKQINAFLDN